MFDDFPWDILLPNLWNKRVIPIIGPGAVTYGPDDKLLYAELARMALEKCTAPRAKPDPAEPTLDFAARCYWREKRRLDRLHNHLSNELRKLDFKPGKTLVELAKIDAFPVFFSTTFDALLANAIDAMRYNGEKTTESIALSTGELDAAPRVGVLSGSRKGDLPKPVSKLDKPIVYHLLGQASVTSKFALVEEDVLPYLLGLHKQFEELTNLKEVTRSCSFLALGLGMNCSLIHFLFHVITRQPLSSFNHDEGDLFFADHGLQDPENEFIAYFGPVSDTHLHMARGHPHEFVVELSKRWAEYRSERGEVRSPTAEALAEGGGPKLGARNGGKCRPTFISYASEDREAAETFNQRCREAGLHTWFDVERLKGGAAWPAALDQAVDECCVFVSLISETTEVRNEGWFFNERRRAADRIKNMPESRIFYYPVRIDGGPLSSKNEPSRVQHLQLRRWNRAEGEKAEKDLHAIIKELWELQLKYGFL